MTERGVGEGREGGREEGREEGREGEGGREGGKGREGKGGREREGGRERHYTLYEKEVIMTPQEAAKSCTICVTQNLVFPSILLFMQ